ncbi:MAG: hypothetical protein ACPG32_05605 [Akkermansiaceae bacterium]
MTEEITPYLGKSPETPTPEFREAMAVYQAPPSSFLLEIGPLLEKWSKSLSPEALASALAATFQKTVHSEARKSLPLATLRGLAAREHLKEEEGGHISAEQARRFMHDVSKTTVLAHHREGKLLAWKEGRAFRFPVWQFSSQGGLIAGMDEVLAILHRSPVLDDWGKVLFFLNSRNSLDGNSALHALRSGDVELVKRLAEGELE